MGLRKPPKGGGVELPIVETPAGADDIAAGKQAIDDSGSLVDGTLPEILSGTTETLTNAGPSHASGNIRMTGTVSGDKIMRDGSKVMTSVGSNFFGTATAADVASGKTFTSAAGLNVAGTGLLIASEKSLNVDTSWASIDLDEYDDLTSKGIKINTISYGTLIVSFALIDRVCGLTSEYAIEMPLEKLNNGTFIQLKVIRMSDNTIRVYVFNSSNAQQDASNYLNSIEVVSI